MAALRHGLTTVIIPADNEKDLQKIDQTVRSCLNFITAKTVDTVLQAALIPARSEVIPGILNTIPEDVKTKSRKSGIRQ